MDREIKYIIVEYNDIECAILFTDLLTHSAVGAGLEVVSAGFYDKAGYVYGKSVTLGCGYRPEDLAIINEQMKNN